MHHDRPSSRRRSSHGRGPDHSRPDHPWQDHPAPGYREIFLTFLGLGLTSFGGPVAHLGYFRQVFVKQRGWLSDTAYAELVALCQFLPGPASSQVGLAIGLMRGGLTGALLAWLAFTLPSALAMMAFALGAGSMDGAIGEALIHSLKLVAVVIVAHAIHGMARQLCPDLPRAGIALAALAVMLAMGGISAQVAVILFGGLCGIWWLSADAPPGSTSSLAAPLAGWVSALALLLGAVMLVALPILAAGTDALWADLADSFYRAGALVFGGGHVVLPLLDAEMVGKGLVSEADFVAGYGAAQAVPGPLFTFAAYLGTVAGGMSLWAGALALVAIFLPGALLVVGLLPLWQRLGQHARLRAAMKGANAAVVGLLGAAFIDPIWRSAIDSLVDIATVVAGFIVLKRIPVWALVLLFLALGLVRGSWSMLLHG